MWNGFSCYQLVLGNNPNLPNIMTEKIPVLQGVSSSEILKTEKISLAEKFRYSCTLRAFMQCEADEKICRELCHQVRAKEEVFQPRNSFLQTRWEQQVAWPPSKVIFQNNRIVFVQHGGTYVWVSTNWLVKDNSYSEDYSPDEESENGNQTNWPPSNEVTTDNTEQLTCGKKQWSPLKY